MKANVERVWIEVSPDPEADASHLYQTEPDFSERRAEYERGGFDFVGIRACAEIRYTTEQGGWMTGPIVRSPGLWSIEDDSGDDYFRSVSEEEFSELKNMLYALGFSATTVPPLDGQLIYI